MGIMGLGANLKLHEAISLPDNPCGFTRNRLTCNSQSKK